MTVGAAVPVRSAAAWWYACGGGEIGGGVAGARCGGGEIGGGVAGGACGGGEIGAGVAGGGEVSAGVAWAIGPGVPAAVVALSAAVRVARVSRVHSAPSPVVDRAP